MAIWLPARTLPTSSHPTPLSVVLGDSRSCFHSHHLLPSPPGDPSFQHQPPEEPGRAHALRAHSFPALGISHPSATLHPAPRHPQFLNNSAADISSRHKRQETDKRCLCGCFPISDLTLIPGCYFSLDFLCLLKE